MALHNLLVSVHYDLCLATPSIQYHCVANMVCTQIVSVPSFSEIRLT